MKQIVKRLPVRLAAGVLIGILAGFYANETVISVILTFKYVIGQIITFCVPLIIIGFIAPSITKLGAGASKLLGISLIIAYLSSVGAALFSMIAGYALIPGLSIQHQAEGLRELPGLIVELNIPPIIPVMSALVFSILIGLASIWTKASLISALLTEFHNIVLKIVTKVVIPLLPVFIAVTFASLAYEGTISKQLPVFLVVVMIVIVGHNIWMAFLYMLAGFYAKKDPFEVLRHYGPAYLTAIGTMSSAATLAVALQGAGKSNVLRKDMVRFGIPLFANIHLCGSVITEVFFVMTVSLILYGTLPPLGAMVLFCLLLGIFAVGAPGVPGGTVMASLGLIISVLGFNEAGTALMLTLFALQDSFGTACNITGDGALTLMLSKYADKHKIPYDDTDES